jgi:hypothetical protein
MPLWAGQSVGLCHHTQASELMAELIAKADVFSPDLNHCRPSFLGECKRAGLLKKLSSQESAEIRSRQDAVQTICWDRLDNFSPKSVLVFRDFEVFKTQSPLLIAGILKEFVVGGLRHVRALRRETAVKGQGLSCVIG